MAEIRVEFNDAGLDALMKSPAVQADLERRAAQVASSANAESTWGGYESDGSTLGSRARAHVWNIKHGARDDESRNNRMIHSLDAARG